MTIRIAAALSLLTACSFGMRGVDPNWDGKSEPVCNNSLITVDRTLGVAFLGPGVATLLRSQDDPYLLVGGVATAIGVLYEISGLVGSNAYVQCQQARTRWIYSNAIKPLEPGEARSAPKAAPVARSTPVAPAKVPPTKASPGDRPWAAGVSQDEQKKAFELYAVGNRDFVETRYAQALARYREAVRHWDHPAIRYNIAVCLIHLDQLVEARDNLERSLAHGAAALGADAHAQALTYRKLLDAQLVRLTISCPEPDEEVMLDGKLVFKGPGVIDQFVPPGEHQLVATKPGFLPASKKFVLVAGTPATYEIRPQIDPRPTP